MSSDMKQLINTVIDNDFCIGCGVCASIENSPFEMKMDNDGKYVPYVKHEELGTNFNSFTNVCPFSEYNNVENELAAENFSEYENIKFDDYSGYYLKSYAGYVERGDFRSNGSSGGMGNWIAAKLLEENKVDGIIHVKPNSEADNVLFNYQVSDNIDSLSEGSKSKYYPIEMSQVLNFVRNNKGSYAIIGIPCFIKGVRLLEREDPLINQRIKYHIGLVCGHLKSDMFAKSIGWQLGIKPKNLKQIDFRKKIEGRAANDYGVEVKSDSETVTSPTKDLYTTNWGHGFFKYNACEFCDDVLAETADVTIGDAWLPKYSNDSSGTNVIVVRHPEIKKMIDEASNDELYIDELSSQEVYQSQAGGFRHRRDGLSFRLHMKDKLGEWRPEKRVQPSNKHSKKRKKIYKMRYEISRESFTAYKVAKEQDNFQELINYMEPLIDELKKVNRNSIPKRAALKAKRELKKLIN